MSLSSEAAAAQYPMIRYATDVGWEYLSPEDTVRLRRGETGLLLHDTFIKQVQRLNRDVVDLDRAEDLASQVVRVRPSIEGNQDAWEYLKGLRTVFVPEEDRERNVRLLDTGDVTRNTFHVTPEFSFTNGVKTNRPDIMFLINGIPVLVVENKPPTDQEGMANAWDQIVRYHRQSPELMALTQLHALTQVVQFMYGATWALSSKLLLNWRDETAGDYETLVKAFVHPKRVLRVISDFILFTRQDEELRKIVLRPHQMRAVDKIVERAAAAESRRGLVWHTQGSGKTYTMITAAEQLITSPIFENPTVIMLVDRNELEDQLFTNLEAVGFGHTELADSKKHLQELLSSDHRGLIVSTIHKFDQMPADLVARSNVFVLVDEAHRTTSGDLGNYLMGALPNATFIGFTGTPVDRTAYGKGTFKIFGTDDERGYLDKYSISESIGDGATVPLHYTLAPNELRVDRDLLEEEFLSLADAEGVADVEELDRVLKRAVTLTNMLKNPDRMSRVAEHVADHFTETIRPMGYKAFLVAVDREACAQYKVELDKHLPTEMSAVVYSRGHNDPPELSAWHLSDDAERDIRKSFRKPDGSPEILIITQKLLTGFSAPILYAMYLDKPMRDHVLLQAIARVNRPYADDEGRNKPAGLIVDYVGVFESLEKALAFDSQDVSGVIEDIELLREGFTKMIGRARTEHLPIVAGLKADKLVEAVVKAFRSKDDREAFYSFFREIEELYEILSPDPFLRPFLDDFGHLSEMYRMLRASYEPHLPVDKSFLRKTAELVQYLTHTGEIVDPEKVYELTEDAIEAIGESTKPTVVKVFNLLKILERNVREKVSGAPYLVSIGERAEKIAEAFQQRQIDTEAALEALLELLEEARQAQQQQRESGLDLDAFSVAWLLDKEGFDDAVDVGRSMESAFTKHPHWRHTMKQEAEVRVALYKQLVPKMTVDDSVELVDRMLGMLRRSVR